MKTLDKKEALKELFSLPGVDAMSDEPMKAHTSLRLGGPADVFVRPSDADSLRGALEVSARHGIEAVPLGGGTNTLVRDGGIRGVVVSLEGLKGLRTVERGEEVLIKAGAGQSLQKIIALSRKSGLTGMEGLSGIPGTLGGAIAGNAGSFGFEIKDVLSEVTLMDGDGVVRNIEAGRLGFGYREAAIQPGGIIVSATLILRKDRPESVAKRIEDFSARRRQSQPLSEKSAGCVFKNPPGQSAGRLIEEAGCKGMKAGAIEVSRVHANFFINTGEGRADDFLRLMELVLGRVGEASGITLEPEIRIKGC